MDKTRASRDGHEFHEAWAARKALQLVMQIDGLIGIAVEGLAPTDQKAASAKTVEIADLTLYYGTQPIFSKASSVIIVQLKYSKGSENVPFRVSDAKKTICKFAAAFDSYLKMHDANNVDAKLTFELITNRPIYSEFVEAINAIASGEVLSGEAKKQATQFSSASGLKGEPLAKFASKVKITGLVGNLRQNKQHLSRILADWSAAPDVMARARLGNLRQLLRDKAGLVGEGRNVITRTDVLDVLELQSPDELFPCPASFPEVGTVVEREQLSIVANRIPNLDRPLLIHADGGMGKTVFLQSLAKVLSETHEVVLFDCFGGGAYRAPEDARHLPKRGLIHIVNKLACDGLCDPLLPNNENVEELVKAFRARLAQAVATLRRASSEQQLLLVIDAIDNAAEHAKDKGEQSFSKLLLESFHHSGLVAGVQLIVSCRTYRRDISRGDIPCEEIELKPFNSAETEVYLCTRIPTVSDTQIQVAYSRSQGTPRILEHLVRNDKGLLDPSEINNIIKLDDLIKEQIQKALGDALKRGYKESEINAFLAGLSVLPPPVPLDEYADAHGMDISAVKSFAADLAPLLEQTRHGMMFRDEPTETLMRELYAANLDTLRTLAENLFQKQGTSVYAASALPGLLQKLDDEKLLFELAFDERFPAAITSSVGKQNIRYARLKAAVFHAARKENFDRLVHLLVELSTLAASNQRGTDYVSDNPDLVIASHDVDATRRLFEMRTRWAGTRHARLTIASVLSGDLSNACRHLTSADEWVRHFYQQNDDYRRDRGGPERIDIAAIPLCLIAQDRAHDAAQFMKGWKDWYAYEVAEHLFTLLNQAQLMETISLANIGRFLDSLESQPGTLAAALSFMELDNALRCHFIGELAEACKQKKIIETHSDYHSQRRFRVQDGLFKAAAIATALKLYKEALAIVSTISHERPRLWSFSDRFSNKEVIPFLIHTALRASANCQSLTEHNLLPQELGDIGACVPNHSTGDAFRKAIKAELEAHFKSLQESKQKAPDGNTAISYDNKRNAERFIDERLEPLLEIAQALTGVLSAIHGDGEKPFLALIDVWMKLRKKQEHYSHTHEMNLFFDQVGRQFLMFLLWSRDDLGTSSVLAFVTQICEDGVAPTSTLVEIIAILSKRPDLQELAGKTALQVKALIEREDEVSERASLFAQLSRAIMPASLDETASYFRVGLEQMDVIGSGDYQFTNELLHFSAKLRGQELEETDFHTLSNICELNMPFEEEKFPWLAFAEGMARTSGCKTLAKLGRWHDREKISLDYTLLPYLTALIEQDKIDPSIALALLRISDPAELYVCGTEQLAEVIERKQYPNSKELFTELMMQFEQNHPDVFMPNTLASLHKIAERELGEHSELTNYLSAAAPKFKKLQHEENENRNYHGAPDPRVSEKSNNQDEENRRTLRRIEKETDPSDEASLARAIDVLNGMQFIFDLKSGFFENLRAKLMYAERSKYIQMIARLETLDIYTKLRELKECKKKWCSSSAALDKVFRDIGVPLVQIHVDEFVNSDYLSGSKLSEIAELSGISMPVLTLELIVIFAAPDSHLPASIWMGLAAIICKKAREGEGQIALRRLLNSGSAKLASTVLDGAWTDGLYPRNGETEIAAGLVWLTLGSPYAACRWRSAHSVRCLARFGKWEVINALIRRLHSVDAHPYQAPELPFYFLHARLWLLIAIARVAKDFPRHVAKYVEELKAVALDERAPHVLLRHFATQALLTCASSGSVILSNLEVQTLKRVNESPFSRKKTKDYPRDSFYQDRPGSMPEPKPNFYFDYDFDKSDVTAVGDMFDRSRWETTDAMIAWIRKYDPLITSMHESGGRPFRQMDRIREMNARHHLYGQQLAWHALFFVAGEFLAKYPVVQRPYDDGDSWREWLKCELLTRDDGLWLSDGVDRPPVDAQVNLHEKGEKGLALIGDSGKLLALLNIDFSIAKELVVAGDWRSADGVGIRITSALAPPKQAKRLALKLSKEDPFQAWLPIVEEFDDSDEHLRHQETPYKPWIVWPSTDARLDETDPLGVNSAVRRLRFSNSVNAFNSLVAMDPFKRLWVDSTERAVARSEAWGRNPVSDEESINAERLVCSTKFLKDVLQKQDVELLVFIKLRRYEAGHGSRDSQYWHTTAVVRIMQTLDFEYFPGCVNTLHEMKY